MAIEIDEEGFLSTTYFSQKDFQVKSNTSLTAKFNSVCEVQDSEAFDKALLKVEEKAKSYKYRGDKGLLSDVKREIFSVNEHIMQAEKSADAVNGLKEELKTLELKAKDLKSKTETLADRVALAGRAEAIAVKKKRYDELNNEKNILLEKKDALNKIFNGKVPNVREIEACIDCNNELNNVISGERLIEKDLLMLNSVNNKFDNKNTKSKPKMALLVTSCALLLALIISIVASGVVSPISIVLGIFTIICAVVTAVFFINDTKVKTVKVSEYQTLINTKKNELLEYKSIENNYVQKIDSFIGRFNLGMLSTDRFSSLNTILKAAEDYKRVLIDIEKIEEQLLAFESEKESFNNNSFTTKEDVLTIKKELASAQAELNALTLSIANKRATVKYHEDFSSSITELESRKSELLGKIDEYSEDYKILNLTAEYLKKADENLKVKYRAPLESSLNKYLSLVDDGGKNAQIDIDLTVTVCEKDGQKATDYYSKGYQNLFEICKRFALTDVLFKSEKPFIILDDPFYNLDDEKLFSAVNLIKKLSEEYQIIYFVCHESRRA